jgi:hypothetical protein
MTVMPRFRDEVAAPFFLTPQEGGAFEAGQKERGKNAWASCHAVLLSVPDWPRLASLCGVAWRSITSSPDPAVHGCVRTGQRFIQPLPVDVIL